MMDDSHIGDIIKYALECFIVLGIDEQYSPTIGRNMIYYSMMDILTNETCILEEEFILTWFEKL